MFKWKTLNLVNGSHQTWKKLVSFFLFILWMPLETNEEKYHSSCIALLIAPDADFFVAGNYY